MEAKKYKFTLEQLPKKTFSILAVVPWQKIEETKKKVLAKAGEEMEIKGFRKGKAPENLIAEAVSPEKLLQSILEAIIPEIYSQAIAELNLKPVVSPKIELVSARENEDWQIKFTSCEEPEINLGDYKEKLKRQKAKDSIWTPGKGDITNDKSKTATLKPEEREEKLDKIIQYLLENIKPEIGDLLLETEVNHKLAELVGQTQSLGLTVDQYLASTGKTVEMIKEEYKNQAERVLSLQLILNAIAEEEKIVVTQEEIEKTIDSLKDEKEKQALESQKYLVASIIRQQKTLDFLANL
jgi:trigger factor